MAGEWRQLAFSEAVLVNPPVQLERGGRYPFVDMGAVSPGARWAFAQEEREFCGGGSRFQHGDTLMARITPCLENGKIARFCSPEGLGVGYGSTEFLVIRGRTGITDTEFAYYLTQSEEVRSYATSHMTGTSGRQRVPTDSFDYLAVPIPPLREQRAIAHILGTLDDKIELNRRMNETLEAMARAIFKSWFIDFDPVRAKMEGRWQRCQSLPGLPAHLFDLWPASFQDSRLGKIPKGWRAGKFHEMIELQGGGTPKTSVPEYWNGTIPWFSVVDAPRFSDVFVVDTEKKITEAGLESSSTKVLPTGTTVISARGTVGKLALLGRPMAMNQSCYGIRPRNGYGNNFTYFCLRDKVDELSQSTHGTVFDTITRDTFKVVDAVIPPESVTRKFDEAVRPFLGRILSNLLECKALADLRDTLLPKLISGELRVKDAERFVRRNAV
jgi:type I restriction enzyme S subunit